MARSVSYSRERDSSFDAIIIGAGANGAGIVRDAAMRGLKVFLLDKGDIASGTTGWSTRLIHGGLRYLEHGEISLVRESLREREKLLRIAPHLVKSIPILIPIYKGSTRGKWTVRAGMIAYDFLSLDKSVSHHRMLSRAGALRRAPGLNPEGLEGAALYYDAQVEYAERLALENALDAQAHGASIETYARVDRIIVEHNAVRGIEFTKLIDGSAQAAHAPIVINVAGPWADEVLKSIESRRERLIGGTKGSHIVVEKFTGAPAHALYVEAARDHRPFFIIPWNEKYLIGTTDIHYKGDLDHVCADEEEIEYLVRETNRVVPSAKLARDCVLYTYAGVRPLPYLRDQAESAITRRHFVHDHAPHLNGLLSIVGGKLTTYRNLAEQTVDMVFKKLERRAPPCATGREPLPGANTNDFARFCEEFKMKSFLLPALTQRLLRVYGTRATDVLEIAKEGDDLRESFSPETGAIGAEVLMSFRVERAQTLGDCLLRRTMVGLNARVGLDAVEAAAKIAQKYLDWTKARAAQEICSYRKYVERFHPLNREIKWPGAESRKIFQPSTPGHFDAP